MNRPINTPQNTPRLFDLIKMKDQKYKPAFYYALENTLVAKNLDQAVSIAYVNGKAQWRVVSLDGELIDSSGTMTGGGTTKKRGGMSSTIMEDVTEKEVMDREKIMKESINKYKEVTKQLQQLEERIENYSNRLQEYELKINKENANFQSLKKEYPLLEERLKELSKHTSLSDEDKNTKSKLLAKLKEQEADYNKKKFETEKLEKELDKYKEQIKNAGGPEMKKAKTNLQKTTEELDNTREELSKNKFTLTNSKKIVENSKKESEKALKEAEKLKEQINNLKSEFKTLEEQAIKVQKQYEETQKIWDEKDKQLKEMTSEHNKINSQLTKLRKTEVDIKNELEDQARVLKLEKTRIDNYQQKIINGEKKYQKLVDDYQPTEDNTNESGKENNKENNEGDKENNKENNDGKDGNDGKENNEMEIDNENENEENKDGMEEDDNNDNNEKNKNKDDENVIKIKKLHLLSEDELEKINLDDLQYEIAKVDEEREKLKKDVNMDSINAYREKNRDYLSKLKDLEDVTNERNKCRSTYEDLRKQRLDCFMKGFSTITLSLKEMYQMITLGGDAELELIDSLDPFSEGVVFSVRPPKKSWKNISNLSGGEKTLSSLALVFALHHYKPTPLYVMDEIDAALDFRNVSIVANYIKERTKDAQFIIISLRNNMFELADRLVGIYKTNNVTKSVTIDPEKVKERSESN